MNDFTQASRRTTGRTTGRNLALMLALACAFAAPAQSQSGQQLALNYSKQVNTFIGTQDDGNTFPGASAPFGMIQVSPIGSHYAGWHYNDSHIRGFGHFFLSGAGCWEQGGQLSVLPVTGEIGKGKAFDTSKAASFDQKKYASRFSHDGEVGEAGYFKVRLTDYGGIDAESTALTRAAAERYRFDSEQPRHLLVNLGQANERHSVVGSEVRVIDDKTLEGKIVTRSFCGGTTYATWFRMEFDEPFSSYGIWNEHGGHTGSRELSQQGDSKPHGLWLSFAGANKTVTAYSAISHVDAAGARANLQADAYTQGKLKSFTQMREQAQQQWEHELASIQIKTKQADQSKVFYTALYHSLLQPLTGNDADGRYRGYDNKIHHAGNRTYYEFFSLWDTYRAQNQLIAWLRPERAKDIANSVLKIQQQAGWLPRWGYANFETNVMTGDPVTPFLVDLWRYGALAGQEKQAYQALRQNAFGLPSPLLRAEGRAGNPHYLEHGYVQYERSFVAKGMDVDPHHGGSATLEYAQADGALAYMAQALGYQDDAKVLRQRAQNWRKVWDPQVQDSELKFQGFPRPRLAEQAWFRELDGSYNPRSEAGFHEGTAWQYQWLIQQDQDGMVAAMGGRDATAKRLDTFFQMPALVQAPATAARKEWVMGPYSYYNQYRYNPNNEPDLHAPWIYTLIGQPWKTTQVLRAADSLFGNAPNGVTGNDDLGTMSAWYVFAALGLYPYTPGSGRFLLHTPKFQEAKIKLKQGELLIRRDGDDSADNAPHYTKSLQWNQQNWDKVWLSWEQLQSTKELQHSTTKNPQQANWGRSESAAPPGKPGE